MNKPIVPVILAGGQGTRLWPMSRAARPKQFLPLTGSTSLFQLTLQRVENTARYTAPLVVTNSEYRFIVAEQAAELCVPLAGIMLEPITRNTAVAIAAAAFQAQAQFGHDVILHVLPSDHNVETSEGYWLALDHAIEAAKTGQLVTFGIQPLSAETGFGYIKSEGRVGEGASAVRCFVEKPNIERAERMLDEGGYFWNSGMFVFGAASFLAECQALAPETLAAAHEGVQKARKDLDFLRLDENTFAQAPNVSVDYAVFEKTQKASVVAVDFGCSDLGSWDAV